MRPLLPLPEEGPVAIGAKLRSSRLAQQLTLEDVSEAAGITKGALSRIERDKLSPSVASLVSICQVLSLPVGALFEKVTMEKIVLERAPQINMGGDNVDDRLVSPRHEARIQVLRSEMEVGAHGGSQLYTVNCDIETVHQIEGMLRIRFADRSVLLDAGDTLTFPGSTLHSWENAGPTKATCLWIISPAAWSGSS